MLGCLRDLQSLHLSRPLEWPELCVFVFSLVLPATAITTIMEGVSERRYEAAEPPLMPQHEDRCRRLPGYRSASRAPSVPSTRSPRSQDWDELDIESEGESPDDRREALALLQQTLLLQL